MRPDLKEDKALDFGQSRIVKGRGLGVRLPLAERLRAARRVPQAVVKVVSFPRSKTRLRELMNYVSRDGALPLETEEGDLITTLEGQRELAELWALSFDGRKRSREAVHIVFSMPPGSNPEALRKAVRTVIARQFAGHRSVFGIHEDRNHPHVHAVVHMRGPKKKLELRKSDLRRLREVFAEAAREQGVMLAASPRAARGVGRKGVRQAVHHLRAKGVVPKIQKQDEREFMEETKRGALAEKPWEAAMRLRHDLEKQAYVNEAQRLRAASEQTDARDKEAMREAAKVLDLYAKTMPTPKTRRMSWIDKVRNAAGLKNQERGKQPDSGMDR
jgi:hypothetical protein